MELIPIIKQTLLIVTVLFLVVLVISYTLSKFKKEKPVPTIKLSPKKRIKKNIKIVKADSTQKAEVKTLSKPQKKKDDSTVNKRPSKKRKSSANTSAPKGRKKNPTDTDKNNLKPKVEKRISRIKNLENSKKSINKNDSGGIGFN